MPDDENDAVADQLVCGGDRLIGVTEVVSDDHLDLLAKDAAISVEIRGRHTGAAFELLAEPRLSAGHRAGHADQNLGLCHVCAQRGNRNGT
jgi:hypothetical protein